MTSKFLIIDGSSLVHRAFYALPPMTTKTGLHTNAVYGFTTMLAKVLTDYRPEYLAVAFDRSRVTFRTGLYAEYKAHRKETPGELSEQFPRVTEMLQALGIHTLEEDGFEADDIIGTLAAKAARETDIEVLIVTGDRDALQLIDQRVTVLLTRKGISEMDVMDELALQVKYGVTPAQIVDMKGLMGDASDNIPGVPGIGEKTAGKLLAEFGSLENVLENIDAVSGRKTQNSLREHQELARLSKRLATIECNMPLEFQREAFRYQPDLLLLEEVCRKYEFRSLQAKLTALMAGGEAQGALPEPVMFETPDLVLVEDLAAARTLEAEVRRQGRFCCMPLFGTEGTEKKLAGLGLVTPGEGVFYLSSASEGWPVLAALLAEEGVKKVTYDVKSLLSVCEQMGVTVAGVELDAMLAAYLLDPAATRYPLDSLAANYLQKVYPVTKEAPTPESVCRDAVLVAELCPVLEKLLADWDLSRLLQDMELPLVKVLGAMETVGIKVDQESLRQMSVELTERINRLQEVICALADESFNINSPKQLGTILFEKLGLPATKKTKTGYSTDAEVLETLAGKHEIVDRILEYRQLTKLKSTYLDGLDVLISPTTSRVHTHFNQMITVTGRLSSSEPNLQNIPIRTEEGRKIRSLFVPGEGYDYLLSADYSQIELRVLAHLSEDSRMLEAFRQGKDIHASTASEVFGVPLEEVTSEMRSRAKAVNFGIVYGISDYGLSRDTGVSRKEAAIYIENYFARYAKVKEYIDRLVTDAHRLGYVVTMFGRRRYLPEINSSNFNQRSFAERTAMNTPIQGTAADIIKLAMLRVYRCLTENRLRSRLLLQVHDELVLETDAEELDAVKRLVKKEMEAAVSLSVDLVVDVKEGINWALAK
ncbi:MAG TPA: DNA polymerase I [Patescibacteria group bacterium]|nr:DNA polymerase I [Patescibacteria group bacterium]